ncbi:MAG: hypothetical protein JWM42_3728 [Burkholderia sp.]|nr:hypothetical protein [Burkholderia sp.]
MENQSRGAGGTPGGSLSFIFGLIIASAGLYMLLDNIVVSQGLRFGSALYHISYGGGWDVTGGSLLVPFMLGVGWIFYNARTPWGWIFAVGSLAAIILGVIMSLTISMRSMSLLNIIIILILVVGGLGLFARSLRAS